MLDKSRKIVYNRTQKEQRNKKKENKKMKNWKIWKLYDKDNNLIAEGRKNKVMAIASARYVYCGIYGDKLYRTTENLTK